MKYRKYLTIAFLSLISITGILAVVYAPGNATQWVDAGKFLMRTDRHSTIMNYGITMAPALIGFIVLLSTILMMYSNRRIRISVATVNLSATFVIAMVFFTPWINCAGLLGGGHGSGSSRTSKGQGAISISTACYVNSDDTDDNTIVKLSYEFAIEPGGDLYVCFTNKPEFDKKFEQINLKDLRSSRISFYASDKHVAPGSSLPDDMIEIFRKDNKDAYTYLFGDHFGEGENSGVPCALSPNLGFEVGVLDMEDLEWAKYIVILDECNGAVVPSPMNPMEIERTIKDKNK